MPRRPPRLTLFPYTTLFRSSRGNKGFVAINREGGTLARTFTTGLPDGHYRNVAGDGSCVTVQGGQVSLSVAPMEAAALHVRDRKSTRLNSSHVRISYAVFCL